MKFFSKRLKKAFAVSGLSALAVAASLGGYAWALQLTGNFHTVIPGELYRSAQPSPQQLADYVQKNGIKTVINLRGEDEAAKWYGSELAEANRLGVQHIDFRMSSSHELSPDQADRLFAIMRSAPKPILVHCNSGADRTGLVSVIYSQQIAGVDEETAERQLSFYYGHVGLQAVSPTYAMDSSWTKLEKHFGVKEQVLAPPNSKPVSG
ncbi:dual specificity protein phosphatase family protein [Rhizobium sp. VS19-DR104.2]|uniref:dual specificity protein phosphatase family protein n=1 Tax=unclassified Rhizobium TaxID=2613769 RepID=UPI001C5AD3B8|nr:MULTISPECIES: dual specificity protein phosphatase family protein [unclassified Rhizobium]MBZ5763400.1 dual specificity protein phosphatase family protein [Rhizobium sp. VS19-DR96]MBZ5769295.1 dual specificity protein phosphatase family protein [Rhizobium sp. VS19-DR129.2]MBZ5776828.1 dual specificity protein phosphatase family protein [Rhizobium sp. VS19-DRK62.2]MBZ5787952.1 dual specificity protein phosphatase family protein [Rhizobium sp. VS19-DR121]MBZ5805407.1 dual specificity protein 